MNVSMLNETIFFRVRVCRVAFTRSVSNFLNISLRLNTIVSPRAVKVRPVQSRLRTREINVASDSSPKHIHVNYPQIPQSLHISPHISCIRRTPRCAVAASTSADRVPHPQAARLTCRCLPACMYIQQHLHIKKSTTEGKEFHHCIFITISSTHTR
jgi:hypothetical protein